MKKLLLATMCFIGINLAFADLPQCPFNNGIIQFTFAVNDLESHPDYPSQPITVNLPCKMPVKNYMVFASRQTHAIIPADVTAFWMYQYDYTSFTVVSFVFRTNISWQFQVLYAPYINQVANAKRRHHH